MYHYGMRKFTWVKDLGFRTVTAMMEEDLRKELDRSCSAWFETEEEAWRNCCDTNDIIAPLPEQYEYVLEANDHGNATLFSALSGEEIWAVV